MIKPSLIISENKAFRKSLFNRVVNELNRKKDTFDYVPWIYRKNGNVYRYTFAEFCLKHLDYEKKEKESSKKSGVHTYDFELQKFV
jgi:hypothetical protein